MNSPSIYITKAGSEHRLPVIQLLEAEKLPVDDLPPVLDNFYVATGASGLIGVIGLEVYGDDGLLRSLAVHSGHRNQNIAGLLLIELENNAGLLGLKTIYLLTETAPGYFVRKGFEKISRSEVPAGVQQSSEFSHVCPASAIVMKKDI